MWMKYQEICATVASIHFVLSVVGLNNFEYIRYLDYEDLVRVRTMLVGRVFMRDTAKTNSLAFTFC